MSEFLNALAKLASRFPPEVQRAVQEELGDGHYFACWAKWEAEP